MAYHVATPFGLRIRVGRFATKTSSMGLYPVLREKTLSRSPRGRCPNQRQSLAVALSGFFLEVIVRGPDLPIRSTPGAVWIDRKPAWRSTLATSFHFGS